MDNKDLYLKAETELISNKKDKALWLKALTLNNGDEDKAKFSYIKLRVEELEVNSSSFINKSKEKNEGWDNLTYALAIIAIISSLIPIYLYFSQSSENLTVKTNSNKTYDNMKKISESEKVLRAIERQTQIQLELAAEEQARIEKERRSRFLYNLGGAIQRGGQKPSVTCKTTGNTTKCQ